MSTPVMKSEDVAISEEQYKNEVRNYLLTLWNVYNFFVTYSNVDGWNPDQSTDKNLQSANVLDQWIVVRLNQVINKSSDSIEKYDTVSYAETLKEFVNDLSTWYLRRSRDRRDSDFYSTLYSVLCTFSKVSAPLTPFISETIYTNLTKEESVHLTSWPSLVEASLGKPESNLLEEMKAVREIVEMGHGLRKENNIAVRQPLKELQITNSKLTIDGIEQILLDELNVKSIKYGQKENKLDLEITPELKEEADTRDLIRKIQAARKELGVEMNDKVNLSTNWMPNTMELKDWLLTKTLINEVTEGEFGVSLVNAKN